MKKRFFIIMLLYAALILTACGSSGGSTPGNASQAETTKTKSSHPDYSEMTLEQIKALDKIDAVSLRNFALKHEEIPVEEFVAMDVLKSEYLFTIVSKRFPEMTMDRVRALGVFSDDDLGKLTSVRKEAVKKNGGVDPALPVADADTGVKVGLTEGAVSMKTGDAVPSGVKLVTEHESYMELDLGDGNYLCLTSGTEATLNRFGDRLDVVLSSGRVAFFFGAPEKLPYSVVCTDNVRSAELTSRAGYIGHPEGGYFINLTSYLGQMKLHTQDGKDAVSKDGVSSTFTNKGELNERDPFSGKFTGLEKLIFNHREIAAVLAQGYDLTEAQVLLTAGVRTEPEIRIQDMGNGTYRRTVIDVNGDTTEYGSYKTEGDVLISNIVYTYNEKHQVIKAVDQMPGNYMDGRVTEYTYYDTGEVKTRNSVMPDGSFRNEELNKFEQPLVCEEGKNGNVETRTETEYNDANRRIHERTQGRDYVAESFYDDNSQLLRHVRTDQNGKLLQVRVLTYHPNGMVATERSEDYTTNGMWYETTYDENGKEIDKKSGKLN